MAGTVGVWTGEVTTAAAGRAVSIQPDEFLRGLNENLRVVSAGLVGVGTTTEGVGRIGVGAEGAGAASQTVTVTVVSPGQLAVAALTVPARSRVSKRMLTE